MSGRSHSLAFPVISNMWVICIRPDRLTPASCSPHFKTATIVLQMRTVFANYATYILLFAIIPFLFGLFAHQCSVKVGVEAGLPLRARRRVALRPCGTRYGTKEGLAEVGIVFSGPPRPCRTGWMVQPIMSMWGVAREAPGGIHLDYRIYPMGRIGDAHTKSAAANFSPPRSLDMRILQF